MIAGHYVTAFFARQKLPNAPIWLLLFAAIALDVVWIILAFIGLETPTPHSWLEATLMSIRVEMPFSHDLLPLVGWTFALLLLGWWVTNKLIVGIWCAGLVIVHWLCDLLVGFKHHIIGNTGIDLGFNLYNTYPMLGLIIESIFIVLCIMWYTNIRKKEGNPAKKSVIFSMYLLFVGGTLLCLPIAHTSLTEWFKLA